MKSHQNKSTSRIKFLSSCLVKKSCSKNSILCTICILSLSLFQVIASTPAPDYRLETRPKSQYSPLLLANLINDDDGAWMIDPDEQPSSQAASDKQQEAAPKASDKSAASGFRGELSGDASECPFRSKTPSSLSLRHHASLAQKQRLIHVKRVRLASGATVELKGLKCRLERDLYLDYDEFRHSQCARCYTIIPQKYRDLRQLKQDGPCLFDNETQQQVSTEDADFVRGSFRENFHFQQWLDCCHSAAKCCITNAKYLTEKTNSAGELVDDPEKAARFCPATWDGLSCWPDSPAGRLIEGSCPDYMFYADQKQACPGKSLKECLANGTWFVKHGLGNHEWTEYRKCTEVNYFVVRYWFAIIWYLICIPVIIPALLVLKKMPDRRRSRRIKIIKTILFWLLCQCVVDLIAKAGIIANIFKSQPSFSEHRNQYNSDALRFEAEVFNETNGLLLAAHSSDSLLLQLDNTTSSGGQQFQAARPNYDLDFESYPKSSPSLARRRSLSWANIRSQRDDSVEMQANNRGLQFMRQQSSGANQRAPDHRPPSAANQDNAVLAKDDHVISNRLHNSAKVYRGDEISSLFELNDSGEDDGDDDDDEKRDNVDSDDVGDILPDRLRDAAAAEQAADEPAAGHFYNEAQGDKKSAGVVDTLVSGAKSGHRDKRRHLSSGHLKAVSTPRSSVVGLKRASNRRDNEDRQRASVDIMQRRRSRETGDEEEEAEGAQTEPSSMANSSESTTTTTRSSKSTSASQDYEQPNTTIVVSCWILQVTKRIVRQICYGWIFTGAVYLCSLLVFAPADPPEHLIKWLIIVLNTFPIVLGCIYVICRSIYYPSPLKIIVLVPYYQLMVGDRDRVAQLWASELDCWILDVDNYYIEEIIYFPNLLFVILNFTLFIVTLIIMCRIRKPGSSRPEMSLSNYVKAGGTLVMLYGAHYLLVIYQMENEDCFMNELRAYLLVIVDGLQGVIVSYVFCFSTPEGKEIIKRWRKDFGSNLVDSLCCRSADPTRQRGFSRSSSTAHTFHARSNGVCKKSIGGVSENSVDAREVTIELSHNAN